MTLVELTVALVAGLIVMAAVVIGMLTTIRETGRIADHVEANQRARIAMTAVVNDLQSACLSRENYVPIKVGSDGQKIIFTYPKQSLVKEGSVEVPNGAAVVPTPVKSEVELSGTSLVQRNYDVVSGKAPNWIFGTTPVTETFMTGVSPVTATSPIFTYYAYSGATIATTPLATPITEKTAATAAQVGIAFKTAPNQSIPGDANAPTEIRNSVLLRMTAPSYNSTIQNLPCE